MQDFLGGCYFQVASVACSIDHATAITTEDNLLVWGNPERLPARDTAKIFPWMAGPHPLHTLDQDSVCGEETAGTKVGFISIGVIDRKPYKQCDVYSRLL